MEESEKSSTSSPRSVRAYHRGNGNLRGGGIQRVYNNGPTFKGYKRKLDYRLGYCIVGCLITIATVLVIFGLFHETAHQELTGYIESTRQIIFDSLPSSTVSLSTITTVTTTTTTSTTTATTTTITTTSVLTAASVTEGPKILLDDDRLEDVANNETTASPAEVEVPQLVEETETWIPQADKQHDADDTVPPPPSSEEVILSFPYSEPDTCLGSLDVDKKKCLMIAELDEYHDTLHSSHIALWNLATVNIIVAMLLLPLALLFRFEYVKNGYYKLFYRVALFLALFFMAAQLIILINPLLYSSFMYPTIVDRLFIEKLPRDPKLIKRVESRFACQFDYISQLVELSLQEPCVPRIKNTLLLPYAIVMLIIIDLTPFVFIFFTYAWDKWLKDSPFCSSARSRIEMNNQRRPQSREDILKKAMEEPHFV